MKLAEIEEPCLQALSLANYAIKHAFFNLNWSNKSVSGHFLSWKKSRANSNSENHLNNENCYFLFVLEGSKPLIQLSIEIHANQLCCAISILHPM